VFLLLAIVTLVAAELIIESHMCQEILKVLLPELGNRGLRIYQTSEIVRLVQAPSKKLFLLKYNK
jgi:hypothetical protein